jgi:ribulose-5-phosphate 4-epimerase/fuculose-1-phosphate aldolase
MDEGYIKFNLTQVKDDSTPALVLRELAALRNRLYDLQLIGRYPGGPGFGNVSHRIGRSNRFFISGSGTGRKERIGIGDFSRVIRWDREKNKVICRGEVRASSESMSHGAIYAANRDIRCVIHVHSSKLFSYMLDNGYPKTAPDAAFGTPLLSEEIGMVVEYLDKPEGVLVIEGHEEGVFAYGQDIAGAEKVLMEVFNKGGR